MCVGMRAMLGYRDACKNDLNVGCLALSSAAAPEKKESDVGSFIRTLPPVMRPISPCIKIYLCVV